ncbi:DUF6600 domain-containing protein [Massilia terrae]|uniref:FecR protein domain-containing protein n=1 Tax=Massilia terrae TaxID=1811224 RepID=A0ABT2D0R7_9BURK|nr:DUF6600 domain-containing protein [Massilia terrae]MCS0659821.1 hypothetical protein [Massilia terrae]
MRTRLLKTLLALAFAGASVSALADDIPSLAGRVALAQGPVGISMEGGESMPAQLNWPVTAGSLVTTARGARTELQAGGAFIRLDGDSSLEVLQLDEGSLRLRLHYGSANIRIIDPGMLAGFELSTPEGRVTLQEPGRIRVDAERMADTSSVTVIEGMARVEGGGASLVLRTGKRADLRDDDVRTFAAGRDEFDDWSLARDRIDDAAIATRYVSPDMTGYTDLDRYGNWQTDPEYGALWFPTVAAGWTPYSDGSWVWIDPWGWTWVDNAPWGYAPFHYGRWLFVRERWCWVPGHRERHPVWSPALVGWVGGDSWRFDRHNRPMPGRGWYPLTPHDRFVPSFRMSDERLRRLNVDVRPDPRRRDEERRGLTVVPQDQFSQRGRVQVANVPHSTGLPPGITRQLQNAAPPAAPAFVRDRDGRRDERGGFEHRWQNGQQPTQVLTAPSLPRAPQQGVPAPQPQFRGEEGRRPMPQQAAPAQPVPQQWHDRRAEEGRPQAPVMSAPQQAAPAQPSPQQWRDRRDEQRPQAVLGAPPVAVPQPAPAAAPVQPAPQQWQERRQRFDDERRQRFEEERRQMGAATPGERFERRREQVQMPAPAPQPVQLSQPVQPIPAPPPVIPRQQPMQAPPPVVQHFQPMPAPRPVMQAERPAPAPRSEPHEDQKRQDQR